MTSTHAIGRAYELAIQSFLTRAPFSTTQLVRVGAANDRGVDLRCYLPVPASIHSRSGRRSVPLLVQCKSYASKLGPSVVREIEGTLSAHQSPPLSSSPQLIIGDDRLTYGFERGSTSLKMTTTCGMVCATNGFSTECVRRAMASRFPIALAHVPLTLTKLDVHARAAVTASRRAAPSALATSPNDSEADGEQGCAGFWMNELMVKTLGGKRIALRQVRRMSSDTGQMVVVQKLYWT